VVPLLNQFFKKILRIREPDFDSRMKVVLLLTKMENYFVLMCVGAPEKLEDICLRESMPHNFHHKLKELTLQVR
jgi:hypothetical protein